MLMRPVFSLSRKRKCKGEQSAQRGKPEPSMKRIQILGPGCARCRKLARNATAAAAPLGDKYTVETITDIIEILKFNASTTPALLVDGEVVVAGRVPSVEELRQWIR
jgi:small redox-active disulfide protein 2